MPADDYGTEGYYRVGQEDAAFWLERIAPPMYVLLPQIAIAREKAQDAEPSRRAYWLGYERALRDTVPTTRNATRPDARSNRP